MNTRKPRRSLHRHLLPPLCLPLFFAMVGCSAPSQSYFDSATPADSRLPRSRELFPEEAMAGEELPESMNEPPPPSNDGSFLLTAGQLTPSPRMVVYTADYRMVVKEVGEAIRATERIAEELDGYVHRIDGDTVTIRVPAARFKDATTQLAALGQVAHRSIEAQDVTEEYVDLQARLNNALAFRKRLEAILEKAVDVKAALAVEIELNRINEEIERLQGKLKLLKNRIAFSTIAVAFERVASKAAVPAGLQRLPFAWLRELDPQRLWRN